MTQEQNRDFSLRDRKRARTRSALRDSALELFTAHGVSRVTVEQICAAAEVSKSSFFRIFPSKEAVAIESETELWATFQTLLFYPKRGETVFATLVQALAASVLSLPKDWDHRYIQTRKLILSSPELLAEVSHHRLLVETSVVAKIAAAIGTQTQDLKARICCATAMATWSLVARDWILEQNGIDRLEFVNSLVSAAATATDSLFWVPPLAAAEIG